MDVYTLNVEETQRFVAGGGGIVRVTVVNLIKCDNLVQIGREQGGGLDRILI